MKLVKMSPRNEGPSYSSENAPLVAELKLSSGNDSDVSYTAEDNDSTSSYAVPPSSRYEGNKAPFVTKLLISVIVLTLGVLLSHLMVISFLSVDDDEHASMEPVGPYKLVQSQEGMKFFDYYTFYEGADSLGSAGYNSYVSKDQAEKFGLVGVTSDTSDEDEEFVYMKSSPTEEGPRLSIRLEGKKRFDRGLFILDLRHMPNGAGVWPAFWLTVRETILCSFI